MTDSTLIFKFMGPIYDRLGEYTNAAVRIAVGGFLVPHGAQKLFGLFGGHGLEATGQYFEQNLGFANGYLAAFSRAPSNSLVGFFWRWVF